MKVPVANGVENSELPPEVGAPKAGVVLPIREGVEPNKGADDEPKRDVWGVAEDDPNREDTGAEVDGVANREDDIGVDGAEGVLREKPLPDEATAVACGTDDVP